MTVFRKIIRNLLWQLLSFLPKDRKKAVCQSFYGRGFSDSPKAVAQELFNRGYKVYWIVKGEKEAASLPSGIKPLKLESAGAIYHQCTSGIWVDSCRKWAYTVKRGKQLYVQTWHGFPLKRIEKDAQDALPADYIRAAKADSAMCDLFLSNSSFLSRIYRESFWYEGEILEKGFPRNDILKAPPSGIKEKVLKALSLPEGRRLMLYAPTFRKDMDLKVYDVDYKKCVQALNERFSGDWLILAKLHPNISEKAKEMELDPAYVINASDYPDIQELYIACDALLTDYSSVMFDFFATGKPCFLYVNDIDAYKGDRNFYFDVEKIPCMLAKDNRELCNNILSFDADRQKIKESAFNSEFGFNETGSSAKACADWLEEKQKALFRR